MKYNKYDYISNEFYRAFEVKFERFFDKKKAFAVNDISFGFRVFKFDDYLKGTHENYTPDVSMMAFIEIQYGIEARELINRIMN